MEYYYLDPQQILHIIVLVFFPLLYVVAADVDLLELGEASKIIGKVRLEYNKRWC